MVCCQVQWHLIHYNISSTSNPHFSTSAYDAKLRFERNVNYFMSCAGGKRQRPPGRHKDAGTARDDRGAGDGRAAHTAAGNHRHY